MGREKVLHLLTITTERNLERRRFECDGSRPNCGRTWPAWTRASASRSTEGLAKIRTDLNEGRADAMRWSFLFWLGQFAATSALIGMLLRLASR